MTFFTTFCPKLFYSMPQQAKFFGMTSLELNFMKLSNTMTSWRCFSLDAIQENAFKEFQGWTEQNNQIKGPRKSCTAQRRKISFYKIPNNFKKAYWNRLGILSWEYGFSEWCLRPCSCLMKNYYPARIKPEFSTR